MVGFILTGDNPAFRLRLAQMDDAENLRVWKNAHKHAFFYQKDITPEQQVAWMTKHLANENDFMFIVEAKQEGGWLAVGCMGYRLEEDGTIDLYNILRGVAGGEGFSMGEAFELMCAYISDAYTQPIGCVVLADNPVRGWYAQHGMREVGSGEKDGMPFVSYALERGAMAHITVTKAAV